MGRTPDRRAGALYEDTAIYTASTVVATAEGEIRYVGGRFSFYDSTGEYDPRSGGGGITAAEHKTLRQGIHLADGVGGPFGGFTSGAYRETLPAADPFPTTVTWWESSLKLKKIVDKTITYNANKTTNTIQWRVYDTDGSSVVETITDTITYSGIFETSRVRAIS